MDRESRFWGNWHTNDCHSFDLLAENDCGFLVGLLHDGYLLCDQGAIIGIAEFLLVYHSSQGKVKESLPAHRHTEIELHSVGIVEGRTARGGLGSSSHLRHTDFEVGRVWGREWSKRR